MSVIFHNHVKVILPVYDSARYWHKQFAINLLLKLFLCSMLAVSDDPCVLITDHGAQNCSQFILRCFLQDESKVASLRASQHTNFGS